MNESARSIAAEAIAHARREEPGAPVRAVHVQPQPELRADLGHALEVVDDPGVRRARARDDGEQPLGARRLKGRAQRLARQSPTLVARDRDDVGVHDPGRRGDRGVRGVRARHAPPGGPPSAADLRVVTGGDQRREVAGRPARDEAPAGSLGSPTRSASHARAWFSAHTAPAPSSQLPAYVDEALIARSKSTLAFVGAPGTNARNAGWSVEIVAGARTSAQTRSASSPPMPSAVIVCPARRASSSGETGPSSGGSRRMRSSA